MANYELIALNEAGPDLRAPTASDTGTTAGPILVNSDITIASGSITSASGAISFGNENLSTTGTSAAAKVSATTGMAVGGATAGTGGMAFPATAVAVADANTLDDYEEGTWTPEYAALGGTIGATAYTTQTGRYTKIGRTVFATCEIVLSNKGSWTGGVQFSGLPFVNAFAAETCYGSVIMGNVNVDVAAGELQFNPRSTGGSNSLWYIDKTIDNADRAILDAAAVSNTSSFTFNIKYTAA